MNNEIWREIEGYESKYQVSNLGRVRSWINTQGNKRKSPYFLKYRLHAGGYFEALLSKNSNKKAFKVHRLVAQAFIPNPENKSQVNHINGIKTDNRVINLEWVTFEENMRHAWDNDLYRSKKGEKGSGAKFTDEQVKQIRAEFVFGSRTRGTVALAKKYGVSRTTITRIVNNKTYKDL